MAVAAAVPYIPATRRKRKAPAPVGFADFSNPLSPKFMHSVKTLRRPRSSDPHGLGSADIKRLLLQYSLPAIIGNVGRWHAQVSLAKDQQKRQRGGCLFAEFMRTRIQ